MAGEAGNCQEFFLLDGRSPVELPDTWGEARAAFREMCSQEGYQDEACTKLAKGIVSGDDNDDAAPIDASPELCEQLLQLASLELEDEERARYDEMPASATFIAEMLLARSATAAGWWDPSAWFNAGRDQSASLDTSARRKASKGQRYTLEAGGGIAASSVARSGPRSFPEVALLVCAAALVLLGPKVLWHTLLECLPARSFARGAEGELRKGDRVKTQWTREEGGNDLWYNGSVRAVLLFNTVSIKYDDGDSWTGPAQYVHVV